MLDSATVATDLITQRVPLEDIQYLLGHADPRTTRLYDRTKRQVTRNIVERISIWLRQLEDVVFVIPANTMCES